MSRSHIQAHSDAQCIVHAAFGRRLALLVQPHKAHEDTIALGRARGSFPAAYALPAAVPQDSEKFRDATDRLICMPAPEALYAARRQACAPLECSPRCRTLPLQVRPSPSSRPR